MGYLNQAQLGKDGRIHTTYTFAPDTGRLASQNPNLQNIPQVRGEETKAWVASLIRQTIVASPGYRLFERDWSAIEALLVGYFAEDKDYMRMALFGPHAFMAADRLGRPASLGWPDEELIPYLKDIKKSKDPTIANTYAKCKKTVHSLGYGMGLRSLSKDLKCSFSEAREYYELFKRIAPGVVAWQGRTLRAAHEQGQLMNPFGHVYYFFEVFRKDPRSGEWKRGKEANKALAFLPQSTAAAMMREALLSIHPRFKKAFPKGEARLLLTIHDSIAWEAIPEVEVLADEIVKEEMERAWPELGGLRVGSEVKKGLNLGELS